MNRRRRTPKCHWIGLANPRAACKVTEKSGHFGTLLAFLVTSIRDLQVDEICGHVAFMMHAAGWGGSEAEWKIWSYH